MTQEEMDHLFQKFSQPTAAISREQQYGGSGLGLVISKKLVELMGGWIEIESVKGSGSNFSFTVKEGTLTKPEKPPELQAASSGSVMAKPARIRTTSVGSEEASVLRFVNMPMDALDVVATATGSVSAKPIETILIVEDNLINQQVMERILKHCNKKITTVNNGLEAVELIKASPDHGIDLIFMDINMPIMDGIKATEEIRKIELKRGIGRERTLSSASVDSSAASTFIEEAEGCASSQPKISASHDGLNIGTGTRLKIIGISGNARAESIQDALDKGMDGHITKPWKKEDIYNAIGHRVGYTPDLENVRER
ncbi:CnHHK4 protein [Chytridiales sp. JEL 0842]|nr:CnHHK4 protein [Chytridiales sp. JEL 0842]